MGKTSLQADDPRGQDRLPVAQPMATPWHHAARLENMRHMALLRDVDRGSATAVDAQGATPLHVACAYGSLEAVQYLVEDCEVPFDDDCRDRYGVTPLMRAAAAGHTDVCRFLLHSADVNVDRVCKWGCSALHYACDHGHTGTVEYLLRSGISPLTLDSRGASPLDVAARGGAAPATASASATAGGGAPRRRFDTATGNVRSREPVCCFRNPIRLDHTMLGFRTATAAWSYNAFSHSRLKGCLEAIVPESLLLSSRTASQACSCLARP